MGFACAALGWSPDQFWAATMHEYWDAALGWRSLNVPEPEG